MLSGGIGTALITTAAGLIVAIPSLFAYRYLRGVVDLLVVDMEKEAMKLVRAFDQMSRRAGRADAAARSRFMRLRVKRPDDLELNLISLVDVVLLLVIFFMLSTTFVQDARLRVELPRGGLGDAPSARRNPIVITISAQGSYRVNDRALVNNERATLSRGAAPGRGRAPGRSR